MAKDYNPEKGNGSGSNGCGMDGAKVPKFFKIVSNPGEHRLRLPPEFTRKYGHNLPDCVSLKVPNGLEWKVELIHSNHDVWLHGGWQRFKDYYSIQLGHLLSFKYVGKEHFEVHIFDTTAMEIEYSYYDSLDRDAGKNQLVESDSDDSVVFVEEVLAGEGVGRKHQGVDDLDEDNGGTGLKYPERKQVQTRGRGCNNRFDTYTRASVFMSKKPTKNLFSIVVMHPSYISTQRSALHIPPTFSKEILSGKVSSSILLVFEGKTWPVRYVCGQRRASLTTGWKKFVEDNHLKAGDACVFELSTRFTCDVIIFRA